ncbi:MAG: iron chelate uptake ABC transporter family permease subunit, partial [Sphaerochaetaceae bacterium]
MKRTHRFDMLILLLVLLLAILIAAGIMLGSVRFSASEVLEGLFSEGQSPKSLIIRGIRLPRVVGSILCGAMLGLCGMTFQAVFR